MRQNYARETGNVLPAARIDAIMRKQTQKQKSRNSPEEKFGTLHFFGRPSGRKKNRALQITLSTLYNPKKPNENFLKKRLKGENLLL